MYCENCGNKFEKIANFCASCGHKVGQDSSSINTTTGQGSVNIGVGNLPNANIYIGNKIVERETPIRYELERTADVKLPLKTSWTLIAGAVGFISAFLDLLSNLGVRTQIFDSFKISPLIIPLSGVFLILSIMLIKQKFIWFQFFGLESDKNGYIHFTRLRGKCPKCDSALHVKLIGPEKAKQHAAICNRNPEHIYTFDPTELPELNS